MKKVSLIEAVGIISDPRQGWKITHRLVDIVVMAVCGVMCGAEGWTDVEEWCEAHERWLREGLGLALQGGVPSHDTFGRLFSLLEAETVQCAIQLWLTNITVLNPKEVVAIDGKHLRRSHDQWQGQPALQVVNAWASESRLMLAQVKVEEDSNEITAVPRLLEQLMLTGCIVTLDAMGTQTEIATQIVKGGADYLLPLKDNQPALAERVRDLFAFADELSFREVAHTYAETVGKRHGRIETRRCWVVTQPDFIETLPRHAAWESLHAIVRLVSTRRIADNITTCERFFITSLTDDASVVLPAIRAHWQVENALHWTLDVVFREDDSRLRHGHSAQNFATLRRFALSWLSQLDDKCSLKLRRKRASWNPDVLLPLFAS